MTNIKSSCGHKEMPNERKMESTTTRATSSSSSSSSSLNIGLAIHQTSITPSTTTTLSSNHYDQSIMHQQISPNLFNIIVDTSLTLYQISSILNIDFKVLSTEPHPLPKKSNNPIQQQQHQQQRYLLPKGKTDFTGFCSQNGYTKQDDFVKELIRRLGRLAVCYGNHYDLQSGNHTNINEDGTDSNGCGWICLGRKAGIIKRGNMIERGVGGVYGCVGLIDCGIGHSMPIRNRCCYYYMEIGVYGHGGVCFGVGVIDDDEHGKKDNYDNIARAGRIDNGFRGGLVGAANASVGFHSSGTLVQLDGDWNKYGIKFGNGDTLGMLLTIQENDYDNCHENAPLGSVEFSTVTTVPSTEQNSSDDENNHCNDDTFQQEQTSHYNSSTNKIHRHRALRRKPHTTSSHSMQITFFVNGENCGVVRDLSVDAALQTGRIVYPAISIYKQGTQVECRCCPAEWKFSASASAVVDAHLMQFCQENTQLHKIQMDYPSGSSQITP